MTMWILTLLILVGAIIRGSLGTNYCPPLWTHYQLPNTTFCYRYYGEKVSWMEAEAECRNFTICGGKETAHLVPITSVEEEEFVVQYWQAMVGPFEGQRSVWIGYSKNTPESDWNWTMPIKTQHQNWHPQMTPVNEEIGCVQQRAAFYGRPHWNIAPCESWHPFICKMRAM